MEDNSVRTLFLPFELGELSPPHDGSRWLFLNAAVPASSGIDWRPRLDCIQPFRPAHLSLQRAGYKTTPEPDAVADYSGALLLLGKHREENRQAIHLALKRMHEGAALLVAGTRTSGIESMRKEIAKLVSVDANWSKHHAQVFQLTRPRNWEAQSSDPATTIEADGFTFQTAPGMFSHKAVDAGSAMLAPHLGTLKGNVADFGSGWGYLSWAALRASPDLGHLHLYEAARASLLASQSNLARLNTGSRIDFHWADLTQEPPNTKFDAVIMNPPFHTGRHAEPDIGRSFIETAAASLRPGGTLLMVANRQLAYEDCLQRNFRKFERLAGDGLYKVIRAIR